MKALREVNFLFSESCYINEDLIIQREDRHNSKWVARHRSNFKIIDKDQYRTDLFDRLNLTVEDW